MVDLDKTNPEFKKLAFTAPGPKNSFAPLQREDYRQAPKKKELNSVEEKQAQKGKHLLIVKCTLEVPVKDTLQRGHPLYYGH